MKTLNMFYLVIYWTQKVHIDFIFLCSIVLPPVGRSSNYEHHCRNLQDYRAVVRIFVALVRYWADSPTYLKLLAIMGATTQRCGCDNRTVLKQHGRRTERSKRKRLWPDAGCTGPFIMFSVIKNIYNKKTKGLHPFIHSFIHSLVFSLRGQVGRNKSPVMWPVWLWHTASWASSWG